MRTTEDDDGGDGVDGVDGVDGGGGGGDGDDNKNNNEDIIIITMKMMILAPTTCKTPASRTHAL